MMLSFHEEEEGLPESFLSNFPSLIKVDIHAKVTDPSVAKSMMGCLLSSLKANGEQGLPNSTHYYPLQLFTTSTVRPSPSSLPLTRTLALSALS